MATTVKTCIFRTPALSSADLRRLPSTAMARNVWTPWRSQTELVGVRDRLYKVGSANGEESEDLRKTACDQVSAWKLRGGLPHAVESTWLLVEACLADELPEIPLFSISAGYVTAISRFVTGLLDAEQDSKYKVSMYAKAQQIGLPALFVDVRHEAAHGEMPSLLTLREAAKRALQWLWDKYWKTLAGEARDDRSELHRIMDEDALGASQPGEWTQWEGPWSAKPIGITP